MKKHYKYIGFESKNEYAGASNAGCCVFQTQCSKSAL